MGLMYEHGRRTTREDGATTLLTCPCQVPATSVIDDIGADDEHATVVIIGGGPHALAALSALHDNSFAFHNQHGSYTKIGSVCVIDPGHRFMHAWNDRIDALEIDHLRSPAVAHPAFEPQALVNFAIREGRTAELHKVPGMAMGPECQDMLKRLPSTALFRDFCKFLESVLPHRWISGTATRVCKDESIGKFHVHYADTTGQRALKVVASAVILAEDAVGEKRVPRPFSALLDSRLILHTEDLLSNGSIQEEIAWRSPTEARVLVIGGGLSAAQAALAAVMANNRVLLRSRRPLQTEGCDVSLDGLEVHQANQTQFESLNKPTDKEVDVIRKRGSVPEAYLERLLHLSHTSHLLTLEVRCRPDAHPSLWTPSAAPQATPPTHTTTRLVWRQVDEAIDSCRVRVEGGAVHVNDDVFAQVILATGVLASPTMSPLLQQVHTTFGSMSVGLQGQLHLHSSLRWVEDEHLYVLGASAQLEHGPHGGALMDAMREAKIVANELHQLMWARNTARTTMFGHSFAHCAPAGASAMSARWQSHARATQAQR